MHALTAVDQLDYLLLTEAHLMSGPPFSRSNILTPSLNHISKLLEQSP